MKKSLIVFLSLFGALVFFVSSNHHLLAATTFTVTSSDQVFAAPNAQFTIDIIAENSVNLVGSQTKLDYDSTQFEFISIEKSSNLGNSITINSATIGVLILNYVDISKKLNGDVVLFTLTFRATQSLSDGSQVVVTPDLTYNHEFITLNESYLVEKIESPIFGFKNVTKGLFGDVNLDQSISIMDAAILQLKIAGLMTLDETKSVLADVNGDASISVMDVAMLQLYLAGLILDINPLN